MSPLITTISRVLSIIAVSIVMVILILVGFSTFLLIAPELPKTDELHKIKLTVPLRVFSVDKRLIAEFGIKRRSWLRYDQVPEDLRNAFICSENEGFFDHRGGIIMG